MMQRSLTITVSHELGREAARERLHGGIGRIRDKLAGFGLSLVEENWDVRGASFAVSALGYVVRGRLDIEEKLVRVEVMLPWMLAVFAEKLRLGVEKQGHLLLTGPSS